MNTYPHLVQEGIPGSPEGRSDAELAAAARTVMDGVYAAQLRAVRDLFDVRAGQGRAATDMTDVALAATYGAVDTVLVDIDEVVSGTIDDDTGVVTFDASGDAVNYGVVDEIARRVLRTGGRVLAVRREDVPDGGGVAAILRSVV